ncbi:hypothetical protein [Cohnella soli]|uniref:Uncharacterized protein n=1 Tax=Cohnella soli TaxID=425005 RepID=A0ABW0HMA5_9BACL
MSNYQSDRIDAPKCKIQDCEFPGTRDGYCQKHYYRLNKYQVNRFPRKTNLQVVLDDNPEINKWFNLIVKRGLADNMFISTDGNQELKLTIGDHTEILVLSEGLDQIEIGLRSLKEKYPEHRLNIKMFLKGVWS